jgi:type I restriction enzyme S subunit
MTAHLPDHLDLIASTPEGIKKLRGLILELAVRGKLVPQEPDDEPASELLKRIAKERARLESAGKMKKSKPSPSVGEDQQPFALPDGWGWSRLATISIINPRNTADGSTVASFVPMAMIGTGFDGVHSQEPRKWSEIKQGFTHFAEGDIGVAKITPCFENSKACVFANLQSELGAGTTELHIVRPVGQTLVPRYVLAYLKAPMFLQVGETRMTGTAGQKRLPKEFLELNPFPLPPLAEQYRIVAKVDELMVLCDELEEKVGAGETAHAKLVETLLGTLTQSTDAAELAANWQRLAKYFDTVFTTESSLDALKQTILQLGMNGRLTNISELAAVKLGDLLVDACYGTSQKSNLERADGAYPVLRIPNVVRETLDLTDLKFSVLEEKELQKIRLIDGDIVVVRTNGSAELVGRCAVVKGLPEVSAFASYMIRLRFDPARVNPEFAQCALRNHRLQNRMIDFARTTAGQYNVSIGRMRELEMPIPPIPEQHRIVAKVDELMALCDLLKADLVESRTRQIRLSATLIESALQAA